MPMGKTRVLMGETGTFMKKTGVPMVTSGFFVSQTTIYLCGTFLTGYRY